MMDKERLLELVINEDKDKLDKAKLIGWISSLQSGTQSRRPTRSKPGDVHMHPVFRHPYVLIREQEDKWICTLLTSDADCAEVVEKCDSRFFTESYFTNVLFTCSSPVGKFMNSFENRNQVARVSRKIRKTIQ